VPAFVATGVVLGAIKSAALSGIAGNWGLPAVTVAVTILVAWAATRYLAQPPKPAAT